MTQENKIIRNFHLYESVRPETRNAGMNIPPHSRSKKRSTPRFVDEIPAGKVLPRTDRKLDRSIGDNERGKIAKKRG